MSDLIAPLLRVLAPAGRAEAYSIKAVLLSQYAADLAVIEQQIGTLLEQRSRLQALQSLIGGIASDLLETLVEQLGKRCHDGV